MACSMIVPAINILAGKVVRLRQGDPSRSTMYSEDPLAVARRFAAEGARRLYVQDLDSLRDGALTWLDMAVHIAEETGTEILFGAALRDKERAEEALAGPFVSVEVRADRIVGTPFIERLLAEHSERLTLRLDVRDGRVHSATPTRQETADPVALARELLAQGACRLAYSDLNRDGMLGGPNYAGLRALLSVVDVPVTVSGGIAHPDHIRNLERLGAEAIIIGKALYTGDLSLRGHLDDKGCWRRYSS